eukprot:6187087-Pleurochrysis_carterae.AAC.1
MLADCVLWTHKTCIPEALRERLYAQRRVFLLCKLADNDQAKPAVHALLAPPMTKLARISFYTAPGFATSEALFGLHSNATHGFVHAAARDLRA